MSIIFDREVLKNNKNRISSSFEKYNFLFQDIKERILEKLLDLDKKFNRILEIGGKNASLGQEIYSSYSPSLLIQSEFSHSMIKQFDYHNPIVMDEEKISFTKNQFDLILSNLNLHFINNFPQFLIEIKSILKKDGIFIASFFGGESLKELRNSFYDLDEAIFQKIFPRVIPFAEIKNVTELLKKLGFRDIVTESIKLEISYSNILSLLKDIKYMGEGNILINRNKTFITKNMVNKLDIIYKTKYPTKDNSIFVTSEVIIIHICK